MERMHHAFQDEHFRVKSREKRHESIDEMKPDMDDSSSPHQTPHQEHDMKGRASYAGLVKDRPKEKKTVAKSAVKTA